LTGGKSAKAVIGVTKNHAANIIRMYPDAVDKVFYFQRDVNDPWHSSLDVYRACASMMRPLVNSILSDLLSK
jgi:protein-tyrosine-phosphatase